eukprot:GHVQ01012268.1.p1 GENE.GHVQ01012268.1~~GHVQ01012268.1.p1  ORF type:complete len:115 (-),score=15.65 GHVQ01012268.1:386-730(-)
MKRKDRRGMNVLSCLPLDKINPPNSIEILSVYSHRRNHMDVKALLLCTVFVSLLLLRLLQRRLQSGININDNEKALKFQIRLWYAKWQLFGEDVLCCGVVLFAIFTLSLQLAGP